MKEEFKKKKEKEKTKFLIISYQVNNNEKDILEANSFFAQIQSDFKVLNSKNIEKDTKVNSIKVLSFNSKKYKSIFTTENFKYTINIDIGENNFIYDLQIIKTDYLDLVRNEIEQNNISNSEKMELFFSSIKEDKELVNKLFTETINLYSKNPKFNFLIEIFVKIYRDKDLCTKLLNEFKKFNLELNKLEEESEAKTETKAEEEAKSGAKKKIQKKRNNIIFSKDLEKYKNIFINIYNESDEIINKNSFIPEDFYGLIFCYLNHYVYNIFIELFKKLMNNSKKILFEILLTYSCFFKESIVDDEQFLNELMTYTVDKNSYFEFNQKCLYYFNDIVIFLKAIVNNKEKIIKINGFQPINIKDYEIKSYSHIKIINEQLKNILEFSEEKKLLLNIY